MPGNPTAHFGRQLHKDRLSRGWSLDDLSREMGIAAAHLSRIENGKRPPTEAVAAAADRVFTDRRGWYADYYQESRTWTPAGFRDWSELENASAALCDWSPGVVTGLAQTADYARALLATLPGAADDQVEARLTSRMARQQRVILRRDPPAARLIVDELSLYRRVGSAEVMAAQCERLGEVAALTHVTLQVMPARANPATSSGFTIADAGAYVEHVLGGGVYTDERSVSALANLFDALRSECYGRSQSAEIIGRARSLWLQDGASRATATERREPA